MLSCKLPGRRHRYLPWRVSRVTINATGDIRIDWGRHEAMYRSKSESLSEQIWK